MTVIPIPNLIGEKFGKPQMHMRSGEDDSKLFVFKLIAPIDGLSWFGHTQFFFKVQNFHPVKRHANLLFQPNWT